MVTWGSKWREDVVRWWGERRAAVARWQQRATNRWRQRVQRWRTRAGRWLTESLPAWAVVVQVLAGWALVTWAVWEAVPDGWRGVTWKASAGVLLLATVGRRLWAKLLEYGLYLLRERGREAERQPGAPGRRRR